MADTNALSGLMKDVYEPGISEGVNNSFPLSEEFPVEEVDYKGGLGHKFTHHHGRNVSPFAAGEDSAYPVAGNQTSSQGRVDTRKGIARIRMTEEAMADLVSSEASFRNGMTDEKTRLVDDISRRKEQWLSMDGRGVLALVDSGSSGTTIELDAPGNVTGDNFGNRFIDVGMYVAAVNPANGQLRSNVVKVTAVNSDGSDITVESDPSWTENDYIVHAANTDVTSILDTSYEKAPWGLPALIDDSTNRDNAFGLLRSQIVSWQSYVLASSGALSVDVMQRVSDVMFQRLGGITNLIIMHPSVRREYIKLTDMDRRYSDAASRSNPDAATKAFKQGDLTLGEVAIKAIRTAPLNQIYLLDTQKMGGKRYVAEKGKFMDRDGSVWAREGTGTSARHAYEATFFWREQNFIKAPAMCARLDGVTGQTLVVVRDL